MLCMVFACSSSWMEYFSMHKYPCKFTHHSLICSMHSLRPLRVKYICAIMLNQELRSSWKSHFQSRVSATMQRRLGLDSLTTTWKVTFSPCLQSPQYDVHLFNENRRLSLSPETPRSYPDSWKLSILKNLEFVAARDYMLEEASHSSEWLSMFVMVQQYSLMLCHAVCSITTSCYSPKYSQVWKQDQQNHVS